MLDFSDKFHMTGAKLPLKNVCFHPVAGNQSQNHINVDYTCLDKPPLLVSNPPGQSRPTCCLIQPLHVCSWVLCCLKHDKVVNGRLSLVWEAAVLILPAPSISSAIGCAGSCSTAAAGGSGQGSGVQCSAHHLKVPAPEVQSFWSFIYYNPLFFFSFFLPVPFC